VGPAAWPAPGEAVVAVPVKPGRLPAGIAPGARVQVFVGVSRPGIDGGSELTRGWSHASAEEVSE